jgi:hypothetical protein
MFYDEHGYVYCQKGQEDGRYLKYRTFPESAFFENKVVKVKTSVLPVRDVAHGAVKIQKDENNCLSNATENISVVEAKLGSPYFFHIRAPLHLVCAMYAEVVLMPLFISKVTRGETVVLTIEAAVLNRISNPEAHGRFSDGCDFVPGGQYGVEYTCDGEMKTKIVTLVPHPDDRFKYIDYDDENQVYEKVGFSPTCYRQYDGVFIP